MQALRIKIVDHTGLKQKHWNKRILFAREEIAKTNKKVKLAVDVVQQEFTGVKLDKPYTHISGRNGGELTFRPPNRLWMTQEYATQALDYDIVVANFSKQQIEEHGVSHLDGEYVRNVLGVGEIFMNPREDWIDVFIHELSHTVFHHIMGRPALDSTHYWDYQMNHLGGAVKLWEIPEQRQKSSSQVYLAILFLQLKILLLKLFAKQKEERVEIMLPKEVEEEKESKMVAWAEAIKEFEGWFEGSRSYRNNNPGNLRVSKFQSGTDDGNYAVFPDYETGWKALLFQLKIATDGRSRVYKPDMSLLEFFKLYAPSSDNNHPEKYAKFVADKIGTTLETKIKDLV